MKLINLKTILFDQDEVQVNNYAKEMCSMWTVGELFRLFPELTIIKISAEKSRFVVYTTEEFAKKLNEFAKK